MNTDKLIVMLDDYLQILQEQDADDEKITEVKLMVWAIQQDVKLRNAFFNNLLQRLVIRSIGISHNSILCYLTYC